MRGLAAALFLGLTVPALAEMRDEEHLVGDRMLRITGFDTFEILTVGPSDYDQMQVLSGADVEIVAVLGDSESVSRLGQPVVVAELTGTHSCDEGDARQYWVVTLGEIPAPEGPVTTCQQLVASVPASDVVMLEGEGEAWAWAPGKGWTVAGN